MLALLSHEDAQPLLIKGPAVGRLRWIEQDEEGSALRPAAIFSDAELSLENHRPLSYRV